MEIKPSMMSEEKLDACWCAIDYPYPYPYPCPYPYPYPYP